MRRIHVLGASGSGTTTLGRALALRFGTAHLDTDDYFWFPTDPPFQRERSLVERQAMLGGELSRHREWVLSGSLCGWGDVFIPRFDAVVFLWIPLDVRLARLRERERQRYGDAIEPGGRLHAAHTAFLTWAAAYDGGDMQMRSRVRHERWLGDLRCPVLRLEGTQPVDVLLARVARFLSAAQHRNEVVDPGTP